MAFWIGSAFVCVSILTLGLILYVKTSFAKGTVRLDGEGISIVKGKRMYRHIAWREVTVYSYAFSQNAAMRLLCISSNPDLPWFRRTYPGVEWAIFYDKHTVTFPADSRVRDICDGYLKEYGLTCTQAERPRDL